MNKIIPDDIADEGFDVSTVITIKDGEIGFTIHASFRTINGDTAYDAVIEHHEDSSIMVYSENDNKWKYYFSPYTTQKYIRCVIPEYAKSKPAIDHKYETIMLINKIMQRNLSVKEVVNNPPLIEAGACKSPY